MARAAAPPPSAQDTPASEVISKEPPAPAFAAPLPPPVLAQAKTHEVPPSAREPAPSGVQEPWATGAALGGPAPASNEERERRPLEDSVVTSAPKLAETGARGPSAPRPMVKGARLQAGGAQSAPERSSGERPAAEKAEKPPGMTPLGTPSGVLRARRDHSKSPGFYSTVSPELGADAVKTGPLAAHARRSTVVGLHPPAASALKTPGAEAAVPAKELRVEPPEAAPLAVTPDAPEAKSAVFSSARLEPASAAQPASFAPPQPCSAPPGSTAIVRAEKEETSPGLGHSRSRHDPLAALRLSDKDLELLAEFALDLSFGGSSGGWIEPTRTAVVRLCQAVAAGGAPYANLEQAMRALADELALTQKLNEENRPRLYGLLLTVDLALGKRLDLAAQKALRERLIVDQLLEELALTQPVITRRLREQGLASLDVLMRMPGEELAGKLESPLDQAEQIVSIFRNYGSQRAQRGAECALGGKSFAVRQRLLALEAAAEAFERAAEGEDSSARRRTRRQRQIDAAQLGLQLAEFGEAKLLGELDRCSVQAKIQRVQRWLAERASTPPSAASAPAGSS